MKLKLNLQLVVLMEIQLHLLYENSKCIRKQTVRNGTTYGYI